MTAASRVAARVAPAPRWALRHWWGWTPWERVASILACGLPFASAVVARRDGWVLMGDSANLALRAWDVGTADTPLLGLKSGIVTYVPGSEAAHPGPLPAWLLAPFVRAFGPETWATLLGAAVLVSACAAVTIALARRLLGPAGTLAASIVLAQVLVGVQLLVASPYTTSLAIVPALLALVAAAAVVAGEPRALPIAVFAASYAAQADLVWAPLLVGPALVTAVAAVRWHQRTRVRDTGPVVVVTAVTAVVCWLGPLLDVIVHAGGNVTETVRTTRTANFATQGLPAAATALETVGRPVDWRTWFVPGAAWTGTPTLVGLALIGVCGWLAWHGLRHQPAALGLVVVAATALAGMALGQTFTPAEATGEVLYQVPALVAAAFCWFVLLGGAFAAVARRWDGSRLPRQAGTVAVAFAAVQLVAVVPSLPWLPILHPWVPPSAAAVAPLAAQGARYLPRDQRFLLVSGMGDEGGALLRGIGVRLEQRGVDACYPADQGLYVGTHRLCQGNWSDHHVLLLTKPLPHPPDGWVRVARWEGSVDPAELADVRAQVVTQLRAAGPTFAYLATPHQIGQALAGVSSPEALVAPTAVDDLGRQVQRDPANPAALDDDSLIALASYALVRFDGVDDLLYHRFVDAEAATGFELWRVPPSS